MEPMRRRRCRWKIVRDEYDGDVDVGVGADEFMFDFVAESLWKAIFLLLTMAWWICWSHFVLHLLLLMLIYVVVIFAGVGV